MILLADGGSTKVDWCLVKEGKLIKRVNTKGANPFFRTSESISEELKQDLLPHLDGAKVGAVHFFGAGCAFPEKNKIIELAIREIFPNASIEVGSDLLAAAIGLFGKEQGIACIIGTGSNSCYYDGAKIVDNVSPLGYVLGDEGSGAVLGRLFVGACLKNQLTKGLKEKFLEEYKLTPQIILEKVYKEPLANRFLASLSPFILKHINDSTIHTLVRNAFTDFFKKNVMQYDYKSCKVSLVGSVAYHYAEILREVAEELNIEIGQIEKSPMDGLIQFYSK